MGFLLRREEVLNVEQLQRMLDDSPVRAAQAILIVAKEGAVAGWSISSAMRSSSST